MSAGDGQRAAGTEPRPLLEFAQVSAAYGSRTVLREVSLTLAAGDFLVLVGPNGAGKSTALKAAFGLAPVIGGEIRFAGRPVTGWRPAVALAAGLAYLPQGGQVFGPLTVAEHLRLAATLARPGERPEPLVTAAIAAQPELAEVQRRPAGLLSGGQKQQLGLAMALLARPKLLLIDEPTIGLAPRLARAALDGVRRLRDETGAAVLLVEQNVSLALDYAERALLLINGEAVAADSAAAIRASEPTRRAYILGLPTEGSNSV